MVRVVVSAAMEAPRVVPVAAGGEAEVVAEAMAPRQREAAVSMTGGAARETEGVAAVTKAAAKEGAKAAGTKAGGSRAAGGSGVAERVEEVGGGGRRVW